MKRLYTTHERRQRIEKVNRDKKRRQLARKQAKKPISLQPSKVPQQPNTVTNTRTSSILPSKLWLRRDRAIRVAAPSIFSMVQNPQEVTQFIDKLENNLAKRQHQVIIDFHKVQVITSDALCVLLATVANKRHRHKRDLPVLDGADNPTIRKFIDGSGFGAFIADWESEHSAIAGRFVGDQMLGGIHGKLVESRLACELVHFATERLYESPRPHPASYGRLIEAMSNTLRHAHGDEQEREVEEGKRETWWASVYYDELSNTAQFSIVDNGVGIFKSLGALTMKYAFRNLRPLSQHQLLEKILEGRGISRTGGAGRGNGIRGIKNDFDRGLIHNATVVSNAAYGNLGMSRFEKLKRLYQGTFIYWEVKP